MHCCAPAAVSHASFYRNRACLGLATASLRVSRWASIGRPERDPSVAAIMLVLSACACVGLSCLDPHASPISSESIAREIVEKIPRLLWPFESIGLLQGVRRLSRALDPCICIARSTAVGDKRRGRQPRSTTNGIPRLRLCRDAEPIPWCVGRRRSLLAPPAFA